MHGSSIGRVLPSGFRSLLGPCPRTPFIYRPYSAYEKDMKVGPTELALREASDMGYNCTLKLDADSLLSPAGLASCALTSSFHECDCNDTVVHRHVIRISLHYLQPSWSDQDLPLFVCALQRSESCHHGEVKLRRLPRSPGVRQNHFIDQDDRAVAHRSFEVAEYCHTVIVRPVVQDVTKVVILRAYISLASVSKNVLLSTNLWLVAAGRSHAP